MLSSIVKAEAAAVAGGLPLLVDVWQGRDLHALKGRGCRALAAVLPLPGVKPSGRIGQHISRKGVRNGGTLSSVEVVVEGNRFGPKLLCNRPR